MKVTTEDFIVSCGCRSSGECNHNTFAEQKAIDNLIDRFCTEIKQKLHRKILQGKSGWDDPDWPIENLQEKLINHYIKGDPIDIAAFCAFWWNKQ
jgi:hypothetical protein